jgi:hypothetical protein
LSVERGPRSRTPVPRTHYVDMEPVRTRISRSALNALFAKAE